MYVVFTIFSATRCDFISRTGNHYISRETTRNVLWSRSSVCLCVCLSVCLSAAACLHYCTDPGVTWRSGRGCPLVVHYWADLQSVHGLCCYSNTMEMRVGLGRDKKKLTRGKLRHPPMRLLLAGRISHRRRLMASILRYFLVSLNHRTKARDYGESIGVLQKGKYAFFLYSSVYRYQYQQAGSSVANQSNMPVIPSTPCNRNVIDSSNYSTSIGCMAYSLMRRPVRVRYTKYAYRTYLRVTKLRTYPIVRSTYL